MSLYFLRKIFLRITAITLAAFMRLCTLTKSYYYTLIFLRA